MTKVSNEILLDARAKVHCAWLQFTALSSDDSRFYAAFSAYNRAQSFLVSIGGERMSRRECDFFPTPIDLRLSEST